MANVKERLPEFLETVTNDLHRCIKFWLDHSHDEKHGYVARVVILKQCHTVHILCVCVWGGGGGGIQNKGYKYDSNKWNLA